MSKWTVDEMYTAELEHGPDSVNTDTYRLSIAGENGRPGKRLDVPGWMVGDKRGAELRMEAAEVIRKRLLES